MVTYVRNLWYMVGWEEEIDGDGFLARTIMDAPILIYRRQDRSGYVAMVDRCPHRFAPLHKGKRDGDNVICGYHGLEFDETGQCVRNPFASLIPPGCRVSSFAIHGKDTILWLWGGDPASADPSKIPDFAFLVDGPPQVRGVIAMEANYELLTDNLMDSSHVEFVHTGTFGGGGVIFRGKYEVREQGDEIWSNWWMADTRPPWASFLPPEMPLDHWIDMRWQAPACMMLEIGLTPRDAGRAAAVLPPFRGVHIVTPESDTKSHYFFTAIRTDENDTGETARKAFEEEDKPMIEAVQQSMGDTDFWGRRPALLHIDAGSVRARRRLIKLRRDEAGEGTESPEAVAAE